MGKLGAFFVNVVILAGIIIVLLVPWYIYSNFQNFNPNIIATIAAALIGGFFALKGYSETKKREIAAHHFIGKKNAYTNFIKLLLDIMIAHKEDTPLPKEGLSKEEAITKIREFKQLLIAWGGTDMINAYNNYVIKTSLDITDEERYLLTEDLLCAIRKDLGHDNAKLKRGEIVKMFSDGEVKEF